MGLDIDSEVVSGRNGFLGAKPKKVSSRNEGLNQGYQLLGHLVLQLFSRRSRVGYRDAIGLIRMEAEAFDDNLSSLKDSTIFAGKDLLFDLGLLKRKHIIYASYLAALSTLPVLSLQHEEFRDGSRAPASKAVFSKVAMAVGTKFMDNINDDWQSKEDAFETLGKLPGALISGFCETNNRVTTPSWLARAENSAIEIMSWSGRLLSSIESKAPFSYPIYKSDVERLIKGQKSSLMGKDWRKRELTIREYIVKVAEKSTGSLWVDPDICFLEASIGGFDNRGRREALAIRNSGDLLTKACLLYDDVVDVLLDLKNNSANAALIYAAENGVIERGKAMSMNENELIRLFYQSGVIKDTLDIGDLFLAKAMQSLDLIDTEGERTIDVKGLKYQCNLLRAFNMRKLVLRDKSVESLKLGLNMREAGEIIKGLPEKVLALEKYVLLPA